MRQANIIGMTLCSVSDCDSKAHCRGWCRRHYNRWLRYGDPIAGRTAEGLPLAFIREAVATNDNCCILWPFNRDRDGYGRVRYNGKFRRAGHVSLEISGRPKPSATHQALHEPIRCHNPACINPLHLRWGLPVENTSDRSIDGTGAKGQQNAAAKLTKEQVEEIRADNRRHLDIADDYGVSRSQISRIKSGSAWV